MALRLRLGVDGHCAGRGRSRKNQPHSSRRTPAGNLRRRNPLRSCSGTAVPLFAEHRAEKENPVRRGRPGSDHVALVPAHDLGQRRIRCILRSIRVPVAHGALKRHGLQLVAGHRRGSRLRLSTFIISYALGPHRWFRSGRVFSTFEAESARSLHRGLNGSSPLFLHVDFSQVRQQRLPLLLVSAGLRLAWLLGSRVVRARRVANAFEDRSYRHLRSGKYLPFSRLPGLLIFGSDSLSDSWTESNRARPSLAPLWILPILSFDSHFLGLSPCRLLSAPLSDAAVP